MLECKVIGIGAAGNKAAIQLIEDGILDKHHVMLLNSTMKDIPEEYRSELSIEFGDVRGAGKERDLAKQMMIDSLQKGSIPIEKFITGDEKFITIVCSTEGGTGSGSSVVLAEYIQSIFNDEEEGRFMPVHLFAFTGFEDDIRGLKNTVDWFNDLNEDMTVETISNKKCLKFTDNRRHAAEDYANKLFSRRIATSIGKYITPSDDNIDDMDLYKLNATHGYMTVESSIIEKIKDSEQFNNVIKKMIEDSVSLESTAASIRIGVIVSADEATLDLIDDSFSVIKETYGTPLELFIHKQESIDVDDSVNLIVSGMKLPINEISAVYKRYKDQRAKLDTMGKDKFFGNTGKFDTSLNKGSNIGSIARANIHYGAAKKKESSKNKFFEKYGASTNNDKKGKNPIVKDEL